MTKRASASVSSLYSFLSSRIQHKSDSPAFADFYGGVEKEEVIRRIMETTSKPTSNPNIDEVTKKNIRELVGTFATTIGLLEYELKNTFTMINIQDVLECRLQCVNLLVCTYKKNDLFDTQNVSFLHYFSSPKFFKEENARKEAISRFFKLVKKLFWTRWAYTLFELNFSSSEHLGEFGELSKRFLSLVKQDVIDKDKQRIIDSYLLTEKNAKIILDSPDNPDSIDTSLVNFKIVTELFIEFMEYSWNSYWLDCVRKRLNVKVEIKTDLRIWKFRDSTKGGKSPAHLGNKRRDVVESQMLDLERFVTQELIDNVNEINTALYVKLLSKDDYKLKIGAELLNELNLQFMHFDEIDFSEIKHHPPEIKVNKTNEQGEGIKEDKTLPLFSWKIPMSNGNLLGVKEKVQINHKNFDNINEMYQILLSNMVSTEDMKNISPTTSTSTSSSSSKYQMDLLLTNQAIKTFFRKFGLENSNKENYKTDVCDENNIRVLYPFYAISERYSKSRESKISDWIDIEITLNQRSFISTSSLKEDKKNEHPLRLVLKLNMVKALLGDPEMNSNYSRYSRFERKLKWLFEDDSDQYQKELAQLLRDPDNVILVVPFSPYKRKTMYSGLLVDSKYTRNTWITMSMYKFERLPNIQTGLGFYLGHLCINLNCFEAYLLYTHHIHSLYESEEQKSIDEFSQLVMNSSADRNVQMDTTITGSSNLEIVSPDIAREMASKIVENYQDLIQITGSFDANTFYDPLNYTTLIMNFYVSCYYLIVSLESKPPIIGTTSTSHSNEIIHNEMNRDISALSMMTSFNLRQEISIFLPIKWIMWNWMTNPSYLHQLSYINDTWSIENLDSESAERIFKMLDNNNSNDGSSSEPSEQETIIISTKKKITSLIRETRDYLNSGIDISWGQIMSKMSNQEKLTDIEELQVAYVGMDTENEESATVQKKLIDYKSEHIKKWKEFIRCSTKNKLLLGSETDNMEVYFTSVKDRLSILVNIKNLSLPLKQNESAVDPKDLQMQNLKSLTIEQNVQMLIFNLKQKVPGLADIISDFKPDQHGAIRHKLGTLFMDTTNQ